jgi:uncharacterized protein
MRTVSSDLYLSPSDLHSYLECPHLTQLDLRALRGEIEVPEGERDATSELIARKGDEHEARYLQSLKDAGREVVEIPDGLEPAEAAALTVEAMRAGAEVIYQGALVEEAVDGAPGWTGFADFMFRVDTPSPNLGDHSYEVADTKLARRTKPYFLLQLCFYSEQVARIQGRDPEHMHVVLGTNEQHRYRLAEFHSYYRAIRDQYLAEIAASPTDTFPMPVDHCGLCRWSDRCDAQRIAEDHLSLVAGMRRDQIPWLADAGIETLEELAEAAGESPTPRIPQHTYEKLHHQARLQLGHRRSGEHAFELLVPEKRRGLALLPPPHPGDLFFDMEGDPLYENGLEYLFGAISNDTGEPVFHPFWGTDRAGEKRAFEEFVDFAVERHKRHPEMHIYHYAHYEVTALKKLMGLHGTREQEVDDLLRNEVFVDLYKVVRQSMRISQPSYSIKKVEAFYMDQRDAAVTDGENSIVEYERYLETDDKAILDAIAEYNEEDCLSTLKLRNWLLERRGEAEREYGPAADWEEPEGYERNEETVAEEAEVEELQRALRAGLPASIADANDEERARLLLAELLAYHWRENKPAYWAYFARRDMTSEELVEDPESVGCLEPVEGAEPERVKNSLVYTLHFPPQEFRIKRGEDVHDPDTNAGAGKVVDIDSATGTLRLSRGVSKASNPLPRSLIPCMPLNPKAQRAALRRVANEVITDGKRYQAVRDVMASTPPRIKDLAIGGSLQSGAFDLEHAKQLASALDNSYLFMQGPPGSGKTYSGSRMIVHLLQQGKRIGVTANSHKAINNLLSAVEEAAKEANFKFSGLKKSGSEDQKFEGDFIENSSENADFPGDHQLIAGTTWLFPREDLDSSLDYLFIDEAGQISLADAVAIGAATTNLILLGDPLQLPQVSQGRHPLGTDASVLEHILGDDTTIPPTRGLFLDKTRRMHPDITTFISQAIYTGRLSATDECAQRALKAPGPLTGTGIRYLPIQHDGNSRSSEEEAQAIAHHIQTMLNGGTYTNEEGATNPLKPEHIMVVTPYNAQVQLLSEHVPKGVPVGTVDKFQGQEAPVVFFSMATSSGTDLPRNLEFLFNRNRLNVAISRAQCLAILVANPNLLQIRCHTIDQMRMVNALCRLVEMADSGVPSVR